MATKKHSTEGHKSADKFRVGQLVRVVGGNIGPQHVGKIGTITEQRRWQTDQAECRWFAYSTDISCDDKDPKPVGLMVEESDVVLIGGDADMMSSRTWGRRKPGRRQAEIQQLLAGIFSRAPQNRPRKSTALSAHASGGSHD